MEVETYHQYDDHNGIIKEWQDFEGPDYPEFAWTVPTENILRMYKEQEEALKEYENEE